MLEADPRLRLRRRREKIAKGVLLTASLFGLVMLVVLLWKLLADGTAALDPGFWTQFYSPTGLRRGTSGILDSLLASLVVLVLTMLIAIPVGTAAGIYLHEYATQNRLTGAIRATVSNLAGVPSVVYGLLGLAVFVQLMALGATHIAAALTMATLILPIIIVATEEALKTVPDSVRQASLALGATQWQTIRSHVLPYALPGVLTGQILALSRAAGETAPLLLLGIPGYVTLVGYGPLGQGAPLQVRIYNLASDARSAAHELAAGAVVVLLLATLALNLLAILLRHRLQKRIQW